MINFFWIILSLLIWVYSYGFVDLNLTLSNNPVLFNFVTWVQQLVYFNRSLSLQIFVVLIILMFGLYLLTLKSPANKQFPWKIVITLSVIFALAYPMLSSDVFKYLFSAKEILVYHANPYTVTPDTFAGDTWIRFMRWVHTTSPYGPVFTLLTIPYYILGLGKFVPTLYLFKLDQVAWYLLSIWLIGKIKGVKAQVYFAFNPLILMEWLVNAHNDAIMITLLLASIYLSTIKEKAWSFVTLLLSVGIKYITVIFLPFIFLVKKIKLDNVFYFLLLALFLAPLLYHYGYQYQPWYVTWLVPFAAIVDSKLVKWSVGIYSFSVFSRYLFFVGTGSWLGTPLWHALMTFLPPAIVAIIILCNGFRVSKKSSGLA
ncbi:MAG: hypothetical protein WAV40_03810 [Microgenomates group bacterium]